MEILDFVNGTPAFVTGSQVYGTPTENSDIDLVLFIDDEDAAILQRMADDCHVNEAEDYGHPGEIAHLRFGKLNLVCIYDESEFFAWMRATRELIARKPVTREEAKQHIAKTVESVKELFDGRGSGIVPALPTYEA